MQVRLHPTTEPRTCGPCTMCCKVLNVQLDDEHVKVKDQWCPFAQKGVGCSIYAERPQPCQVFVCLWLKGGLPAWARPDRVHGVVQLAPDKLALFIHEDPGWRGTARMKLKGEIGLFLEDPARAVIVVCGGQHTVFFTEAGASRELQDDAADEYIDTHLARYLPAEP